MAQPSVFGQISGHPVGTWFPNRAAVKAAGLDRHLQAGISGDAREGADAIVVSGGYPDDEDYGDRILYTGQGGQERRRQVEDQKLMSVGCTGSWTRRYSDAGASGDRRR